MQHFNSSDIEVLVLQEGEGRHAPILFCIHGIADNAAHFSHLVGYFPKHYRVLSVSLPGHGASRLSSNHTITSYAEVLSQYFEQEDISTITLLGHSMGGMVALELALRCPERIDRVITLGTPLSLPYPSWLVRLNRWVFWLAPRIFSQELQDMMFAYGACQNPRAKKQLASSLGEINWMVLYEELLDMAGRDNLSIRSQLVQPVDHIVGTNDALLRVFYKGMKHRILKHVHTITDANHCVFLDQPEEVSTIIQELLSASLPKSRS